ncbi:MAG: ParB N-terminal domain-containing protein [Anaerolineae bacterium]|nr:ParB N-terminal domain-containing protein [Anaerolineae bacterium]
MDIAILYVSQRKLRQVEQIPALIEAIHNGDYIPPIRISEAEDGTLQVDDGHHRAVAYWLSGRRHLERHEYDLVLTERYRTRFGFIPDLLRQCSLECSEDPEQEL